jgi:hypothetical protein
MKPSDFTNHPHGSVLSNYESEQVARNIMVILARTGNKFRVIAWDEYRDERKKDGNFSEKERGYFDRVSGFCVAAESAVAFCRNWES